MHIKNVLLLLIFLGNITAVFAAPSHLEPITLQLKWTNAFQFAGYYAAKEQGYYRDAGLEVAIQEATPATDPVKTVLEGKAQYGVGTSSLLISRAQGKPVVVLAVVFQQSPYEIHTLPEIHTLKDLIGKRIMIEPQADELLAYLKKEGVPLNEIRQIPHSFKAKDLMVGKTEAMSGYLSNEPYYFRQANFAYQTFSPRSAGIDFYGDNLFTTAAQLREHPEQVRAFRAASMRGWKYAKEHRDEIIKLILSKYAPNHTRDYLRFESDQMIPLLQPDLIEIGYMNPARWQHIANTYASLNLVPKNYQIESGFLYDATVKHLPVWVIPALIASLVVVIFFSFFMVKLIRLNRRMAVTESQLKLASSVFTHAREGIAITDSNGIMIDVNDTCTAMSGYSREELIGENMRIFQSGRQSLEFYTHMWDELINIGHWSGEIWNRRKNGEVYAEILTISAVRGSDGKTLNYVALFTDITVMKEHQSQLEHIAHYDILTNLPNRALLTDRLSQSMAQCQRRNNMLAVLFLDLDGFKAVNDTYGHGVGDELLIIVSQRMKTALREGDTLARIGGDEFIAVLIDLEKPEDSTPILDRLLIAVSNPVNVGEVIVEVSASIGVAFFPNDSSNAEHLMRDADQAMYCAKESGKNRYHLFGQR